MIKWSKCFLFTSVALGFLQLKTSAMMTSDQKFPDEFDLQEQNGILHPEKTKILDFNFAKSDTPEKNKVHMGIVCKKYLTLAQEWPSEKEMPRDYAKAIGASFTWLNLYNSSALCKLEPSINKLILSKKLFIEDLWLKNLPRANARSEDGRLSYARTILQFNKRMFSDFKGSALLIGAGHTSHLREVGEPYCRTNEQPTLNSLGRMGYKLDTENYYINIEVDPDVVGNAYINYNISPFPGNMFKKIIFNYIYPS